MFSLLLLLACHGPDDETGELGPPALDVSEPLQPGAVRVGVVTDDSALFGGLGAEGQVGDIKIYNDRIQFIVQGMRPGSSYIRWGGTILDADLVRPDGQPGRDALDDWSGMYGLARLLKPDSIQITQNGEDGEARLVIEGEQVAMDFMNGALEADLIEAQNVHIVTEYILRPDSWLMEVNSTMTLGETTSIVVGDVLMGGKEVMDDWDPVVGLKAPSRDQREFTGMMGRDNELAYAVIPEPGEVIDSSGAELLNELIALSQGWGQTVDGSPGDEISYRRFYGVAPDLATLTDARYALWEQETETLDGVVTAADGPVAGARVMISLDDEPYTIAVTADDGSWSAQVPDGATATALAVGRSTGRFADLPEGAAPWSMYTAETPSQITLDALRSGADGPPVAKGRGVADAADPMVLGQPAELVVRSGDDSPFEVRLAFTDGDPVSVDDRLVHGRPGGPARGYARDGEVTLWVEPGTYDVMVWRGARWEIFTDSVTLEAGEETVVDADLVEAYTTPGWMLGDAHMHGAPSPDGKITMEGRVITAAANGLDLAFATEHDHIGDYRPLIDALDLGHTLNTVVATEVSPVRRGHLNLYPLTPVAASPNNGGWQWWLQENRIVYTEDQFTALREKYIGEFYAQVNHAWTGMGSAASWSEGSIREPDMWSWDFQVLEIRSAGELRGVDMYTDLVMRGQVITPTGGTDQHGWGTLGMEGTWIGIGTNVPAEYTDDDLREALRAQRTQVMRGPFLDMSIDPGALIGPDQTLTVEAMSPTWIVVDRLTLYKNGEIEAVTEGTTATWPLDATEDAAYWVTATGDAAMEPITGRTPWTMSAIIRVDVAGDGWQAPLPAYVMGE